MTDIPQLSGSDLARQALANARKAARATPAGPARAKKTTLRRDRTRRDPVPLADAITHLGADLPLTNGLAGGNVIDQWATLCPQYATTVQPVAYDPARGRLDLRPASHAYATQLRLLGGQLAKQINDKAGSTVVRSIRVLAVGNVTPGEHSAPEAAAAEPEAPIRTRETASDGYRRTLEAHQAAKPDQQPTNEYVQQARARQDASLAAPCWREPETQFAAFMDELERTAAPEADHTEALRRAAIARKRHDHGGQLPRRALDVT